MTLQELCEPFFQCVCRINRAARKGGGYDMSQIRADIRNLLGDMHTKSLATPGLREQFEKVRLPLIFFADYTIRSSTFPFARQWTDLAQEEPTPNLAGDEMFFKLLDPTLADRSDDATERLAIFYTCLGLGFRGFFEDQPEKVQQRMGEAAGRLRHLMDVEESARICPDAYTVNTSNLTLTTLRPLTPIAMVLVALVVMLFILNALLYVRYSRDLSGSLEAIQRQSEKLINPATQPSNDSPPSPMPAGEK